MSGTGSYPSDGEHRVVRFRRNPAGPRTPLPAPSPIADLTKYEHGPDTDDYRHRMLVNLAAFVFVMALIGAGLWIADTMAQMRRNQDCVLTGRRGCSPVEVPKNRW